MKKKFLVLLTTLLLGSAFTLGMTACDFTQNGNSSSSSSNSSGSSSAEENPASEGLKYTLLADDTYEVSGIGSCTDTEMIIPSSYNEKAVTSIGENAFVGCSSLTGVTIPDSVMHIGDFAFENCTSLTSVEISGNATSIGNFAFLDCDDLTSVTILDGVASIEENAFKNCENLTDVYISNIEAWCRISFGGTYANPLSYGGNLYIDNELLTELEIPNTITEIKAYAFLECSSLTRIVIPDSVTSIGANAFENCTGLTSVEIPSGVTSMGARVFYGCNSLMVYCQAKSRPLGWNSKWSSYSWNDSSCLVVWDCKTNDVATDGYTYVIVDGIRYKLKDDVATVARQAKNITTAQICENVTYKGKEYPVMFIDEDAFTDCEDFAFNEYGGAKYVASETNDYFALIHFKEGVGGGYTIHSAVKLIADSAFQGCSDVESIVLPHGVISIGSYAFYGCDRLYGVTIPDSVTYIGEYAFAFNRRVTKITIPDGVMTIEDCAFYYCSNLKSVEIGNDVTSIGDYAFSNCGNLTSVTIGNDVTSIGDYAFSKCGRLTSVTIGERVTSIGVGAFHTCTGLTSIVIPHGVTSIGREAFYLCYQFVSIVIPESVTSIGENAFYGCGETTNVYYGGLAEAWADIAVGSANSYLTTATIYYYIEKEEDVPTDGGKYWHYDENGEITAW